MHFRKAAIVIAFSNLIVIPAIVSLSYTMVVHMFIAIMHKRQRAQYRTYTRTNHCKTGSNHYYLSTSKNTHEHIIFRSKIGLSQYRETNNQSMSLVGR